MRTLLLDGDVFAYQSAAAVERVIHWSPEISTLESNLSEATAKMEGMIEKVMNDLKADAFVVALSDIGSGYWRRQVLPTYKFNRTATRKPLVLLPLREYLIEKYGAKLRPMLEGDDVLGILATNPKLIRGEKIILSIDKDMATIPGLFCRNRVGHPLEIQEITVEQADRYHMYQTLIGDTTDGYKGCPGIGPVAAEKILSCPKEEWWPAIVTAFKKAGLSKTEALTQARVARILRHEDYNYQEKIPILWQSPVAISLPSPVTSTPPPVPSKPEPSKKKSRKSLKPKT